MASIDTELARLRRRAAKNGVEVEHLTALAAAGDAAAVPVIRELQDRYRWSRSNRDGAAHIAPLGRWAEVVCAYLEGGPDALLAYARRTEPESFYFAVSVLEALKSPAAVGALAELAREVQPRLPERLADAVNLAASMNQMLSFRGAPVIDAATSQTLREFLHSVLHLELKEAHRATVVCALRGVGNEESLRLLERMPPFGGPWAGLESLAVRAIRKRIRRLSDRDEA